MKFKSYLIIALAGIVLLSTGACNRPKRAEVVNKLKSSAKLATVEYVVTKVISAKKERLILKDVTFFAETEATIKAGIDLNKLREQDIVIVNKKINLTLPPIEIISFSYPAEGYKIIKKYSDSESLLKWNSIGIEDRDALFRKGEEDIRANIDNLGITKTAEKKTIQFLTPILKSAGFDEIYIQFREDKSLQGENEALQSEVEELRDNEKKK